MSLWNTVNQLAEKLPEGYVVKLGIENGSAWVELFDELNEIDLPDSTDRNLQEQLTDALTTALKSAEEEQCPTCGEPYWKCDHWNEEFENE